ncbi:nucleotidyltransferase domain-containing protein [Sulfurospirillum sp. 'SP']|nr:nucleotidyltransferase domain-containing protein [Sulfurospirillum sp. 'SP']WNZ00204.1 nucleotidyltransferase domain-containing protein [Sulfurospirillum sp. 'SP']
MVDIEKLKHEIVERLKPLDPDKIILFGSYAYGTPTEDSDIDLCIVESSLKSKSLEKAKIRSLLSSEAQKSSVYNVKKLRIET